jgi:hypothetical protein
MPQGTMTTLAAQLAGESSILDGISEPISLNEVYRAIFRNLKNDFKVLAECLGYQFGEATAKPWDLVWVPPGQTVTKGSPRSAFANAAWHTVTGPAFAPDYANHPAQGDGADQLMGEGACSIEFTNLKLTYSTPVLDEASLRWVDAPSSKSLYQLPIDNRKSPTDATLSFSAQAFQQGVVGAVTEKNWNLGWNWQLTANETYNSGGEDMMFPSFSLSLTESGGMTGSGGGSEQTSTQTSIGTTTTVTISEVVPSGDFGVYEVTAMSGTGAVNFTCVATLEYSVSIYGLIRPAGYTDGGYTGNYFNGDDPKASLSCTLGDKNTPWWDALADNFDQDDGSGIGGWEWRKMANAYPGFKWLDYVKGVRASGKASSSFPVNGVMAAVQRSDVQWTVVSVGLEPPPGLE